MGSDQDDEILRELDQLRRELRQINWILDPHRLKGAAGVQTLVTRLERTEQISDRLTRENAVLSRKPDRLRTEKIYTELRALSEVLGECGFDGGTPTEGVMALLDAYGELAPTMRSMEEDAKGLRKLLREAGVELCRCGRADALMEALGHTPVGHKTGALLTANGVFTKRHLLGTPDADLLLIPGLGDGSMDLIHQQMAHCKRWPARSRTASEPKTP